MKLSRRLELRRDQTRVWIAKDFKRKDNSTALGFLWSLLMSILTSLVCYFVFGVVMRFSTPNDPRRLMGGTFLWQLFTNVVLQCVVIVLSIASFRPFIDWLLERPIAVPRGLRFGDGCSK